MTEKSPAILLRVLFRKSAAQGLLQQKRMYHIAEWVEQMDIIAALKKDGQNALWLLQIVLCIY